MSHLHPSKGGCWFCHEDEEYERHCFDEEFDTYVHRSCIRIALEKNNPEAEIMQYLLGDENE